VSKHEEKNCSHFRNVHDFQTCPKVLKRVLKQCIPSGVVREHRSHFSVNLQCHIRSEMQNDRLYKLNAELHRAWPYNRLVVIRRHSRDKFVNQSRTYCCDRGPTFVPSRRVCHIDTHKHHWFPKHSRPLNTCH